MKWRRRLSLVAVAAAAGACLFPPTGDLIGDGGFDATFEVGSDVASEATASDAASDVLDATFVDVFVGCPTLDAGTVFCENFDDTDAATFAKWSKANFTAGATAQRVASDASPPFAVEFLAAALDAGAAQAEIGKPFPNPGKRLTYAFSLRVSGYPTLSAALHLSPIQLTSTSQTGSVEYLSITSSQAQLTEEIPVDGGYAFSMHTLSQSIVAGSWVAVREELDQSDGGIVATVYLNGVPVFSGPLDARSQFGVPTVFAGLSYVSPALSATVDIDNIVITVE